MNQSLTVPELDHATAAWIEQEAQRRGVPVENVVRDLIYRGIEVEREARQPREYHDLDALAGTWSEEELVAFERATKPFEDIDTSLWQ